MNQLILPSFCSHLCQKLRLCSAESRDIHRVNYAKATRRILYRSRSQTTQHISCRSCSKATQHISYLFSFCSNFVPIFVPNLFQFCSNSVPMLFQFCSNFVPICYNFVPNLFQCCSILFQFCSKAGSSRSFFRICYSMLVRKSGLKGGSAVFKLTVLPVSPRSRFEQFLEFFERHSV